VTIPAGFDNCIVYDDGWMVDKDYGAIVHAGCPVRSYSTVINKNGNETDVRCFNCGAYVPEDIMVTSDLIWEGHVRRITNLGDLIGPKDVIYGISWGKK
jgi:hypothetical protein